MNIFLLQYAIAVLVCLCTIRPFRRVSLGKYIKIPLPGVLGIFLLAFLGFYCILDEFSQTANISFIGKAFFLWINQLLFAMVPAGFVFLKNEFRKQKLRRRDLLHLTPSFIYIAGFIYPYVFYDKDFLSSHTGAGIMFRIYSYCTVSVYILLVMRLMFYKYAPFFILVKELNTGLQSDDTSNTQAAPDHTISVGSVHLSEDQLIKMDEILRNYFSSQQPFLKRGYSLKQLSDDTALPLHHLSAFINKHYQLNFNDFVNEYRVKYCQNKIRNDEWRSKTLEAIAEESGFNNRNTFTAAFKKVTGRRPSDFLRMVKQKQIA
jgi:AraC-like DNA-binding protein